MVPENVVLTAVEAKALEDHVRKNGAPMSPITAANFFLLFAEDYTLEKILSVNPSWTLGCLVDARIRYKWDDRLAQYVEEIHKQALTRMSKFKAEMLNQALDMFTLDSRIKREEMMRYMQNPTDENLPKDAKLSPRDMKDILEVIERVMKIGQALPPQPSPTTSIYAAPGSTVIASSGSMDAAAIAQKMAEAERAKRNAAKGRGSNSNDLGS